jgi:hypothetical protein
MHAKKVQNAQFRRTRRGGKVNAPYRESVGTKRLSGYLIQPTGAELHNQRRVAETSPLKAVARRSVRPGALPGRISTLGKKNDIGRRGKDPVAYPCLIHFLSTTDGGPADVERGATSSLPPQMMVAPVNLSEDGGRDGGAEAATVKTWGERAKG